MMHDDDDDRSDEMRTTYIARPASTGASAAFFGWLVAVALTILLAGIVGAIATAVCRSLDVNRDQIERNTGTFGVATAVALLLVLMIAYYAGGYVAGRMSRYDGGRQGLGVRGGVITFAAVLIGSLVGAVVGGKAGRRYHGRIDAVTVSGSSSGGA